VRDGKRDFGEDQGRGWARSLELERGERKGREMDHGRGLKIVLIRNLVIG